MRSKLSGFSNRVAVLLISVLTLPLSVAPAQKNQSRTRFDPDGSFWIHGTPPKDFENIGGINLNSKRARRLPAPGVELVNGTRFGFKTLTVKKESLLFTTTVVKGTSYSFSGRFLKGGVFASDILDTEAPVLEGTLTKWTGGRKVAEANLKFTYFGGT